MNRFVVIPIRLVGQFPGDRMDQTAIQGDGHSANRITDPKAVQRFETAMAQGQIYRPVKHVALATATRIASIVKDHPVPSLTQKERKYGTDQTGPYYSEIFHGLAEASPIRFCNLRRGHVLRW